MSDVDLSNINRLEVIDGTETIEITLARAYVKHVTQAFDIELVLQDDNRTLKLFLTDKLK